MKKRIIEYSGEGAVTFSKRELKSLGLVSGMTVGVSLRRSKDGSGELVLQPYAPDPLSPGGSKKLTQEYEAFKDQYGDVLKNLADR